MPFEPEIIIHSSNSLTIKWQYNTRNIEGFKIDKKEGNNEWIQEFTTVPFSQKNFTDNSVNSSSHYIYSIYAFAGNNNSSSVKIGTFLDPRDGTEYRTMQVGNQIWMAENLKYLPSVVGAGTGSVTNPCYYVYGYSGTDVAQAKTTANYKTYGVLYNWSAAMAGFASSNNNPSGVQGVCPTGWHLPSDAEWDELIIYLGGDGVAGGKLKEADTLHWSSPNTGATNETGFTALPAGYRYYIGAFGGIDNYGYWWCATEANVNTTWCRRMSYDASEVFRSNNSKESGFSVRCVRD